MLVKRTLRCIELCVVEICRSSRNCSSVDLHPKTSAAQETHHGQEEDGPEEAQMPVEKRKKRLCCAPFGAACLAAVRRNVISEVNE